MYLHVHLILGLEWCEEIPCSDLLPSGYTVDVSQANKTNLFNFIFCCPSSRGGLNSTMEAMGQQVQKAAVQAASTAAANEMQNQMNKAMSGFLRK